MIETAAGMVNAALIFRTHFWDDFAQRQFEQITQRAAGLDVFVLVDETNGPVNIPYEHVVRVTEAELLAMGLARAGEGNLLWFNGDYPLYRFVECHGGYDYYLQLEYDVSVQGDLSQLVSTAARDGADFVGLTKGEETPVWPWVGTCDGVYDLDEIRHQLICVSLFSRRALELLWRRRREQSEAYAVGKQTSWPMCEAFIATELHHAGLICRELSAYSDTSQYDHWPPYLETDLPKVPALGFVHPLLDEKRYVASLLKYKIGLAGYLNPNSLYHRKLRRLRPRRYVSALASSFTAKAVRTLKDGAQRLTVGMRGSQPQEPRP